MVCFVLLPRGKNLLQYMRFVSYTFVTKSPSATYSNADSTIIEAHRFFNAKLNEERLPPLSYRISADYGMVEIARSITSASDDLFGSTMNRCAKIN